MKNLLTQIKNEWRSNLFLLVELLLVFAVLWYIVDWVTVTARVYRAPMGFDTEHCYNLSFSTLTSKSALYNPELTVEDNIDALLEITERLRHRPGVEAVSISQNCYPYNEGSNSAQFYLQDSIHVGAYLVWSDPDFYRVFRYQAVDGGSSEQLAAAISDQTMIITSNITEDYPVLDLPDARPLLNREVALTYPDRGYHRRIAAIAVPVRRSHFETSHEWGGAYRNGNLDVAHVTQLINLNRDELINELGNVRYVQVSLRVSPDADKDFVDALMADADRLYRVGNIFLLEASSFSDIRHISELEDVNEVKTQLCILFFLMLNIFLGVIGTFWFRTQHRRREVALRMAMGSSRRGIFLRLMGEGILLLTVAAIPALIIAFNVGIAELVDISKMQFTVDRFLIAAILTWLLMALMIIVGIWYPAYKAMQLQPADALHDE